MSDKSKTPYELRFDLLTLSKDMLERQFEIQREYVTRTNEILIDEYIKAGKSVEEALKIAALPKYPSFEDIAELARKFNKFVSQGE